MSAAVAKRFWSKVDKNGPVPEHCPELGPCWVWTGAVNRDGYGQFRFLGRTFGAHQVARVLAGRSLIPGVEVCHRCDNRPCVRDSHLFNSTHLGNVRDMHAKGRARKAVGDANGSRLHPESRPRGDRHPARRCPESVMRGERNGMARLTRAAVAEIRSRWPSGGLTYVGLAREYGVCETTIRNVVLERTWLT